MMPEEHVDPILQKPAEFTIVEGSALEIIDQIPSEVVKGLAEITINSSPNLNVNSFLSNGRMIQLNKKAHDTYSVSYKMNAEHNRSAPTVNWVKNSTRENVKGGVADMEVNVKDYIDDRIGLMEKSMDHRLDATEKLLAEKIDHVSSKLEGIINNQSTKMNGDIKNLESNLQNSIETKISEFKVELSESQRKTKYTIIGWMIGVGAIIATVATAFF